MPSTIACRCGYRGVAQSGRDGPECPICRAPARPAERTYRIACPKRHVITVREAWLGQEMVCPTCDTPFLLNPSDTLERRAERRRRRDAADAKLAQVWFTRAIVAAVIVALLFVAMVVLSANPQLLRR